MGVAVDGAVGVKVGDAVGGAVAGKVEWAVGGAVGCNFGGAVDDAIIGDVCGVTYEAVGGEIGLVTCGGVGGSVGESDVLNEQSVAFRYSIYCISMVDCLSSLVDRQSFSFVTFCCVSEICRCNSL